MRFHRQFLNMTEAAKIKFVNKIINNEIENESPAIQHDYQSSIQLSK